MKQSDLISRRVKWLSAIFLFCAAFLVARFADIQVFGNPGYAKRTVPVSAGSLPAPRGELFLADRFGALAPFAVNRDAFVVYAEPQHISEKDAVARAVSEALSLSYAEVFEKLSKANDPYEPLASRVSEEVAKRIEALHLQGIGIENVPGRYYPFGKLASHLAGFVGMRGDTPSGQYGLEGFYEEALASEGGDIKELALSVDPHVQFQLENILKKAVERWTASGGTAIVMEPSTGRILGMASYPDFDPNEYGKAEDISVFANQAVSGQFELGSVFKPVTMAAGLNEKKVTPDTTYTDTGFVSLSGYTIRNFDGKSHGTPTMSEVLEKSLNTGVIFVQQQLRKSMFRSYVEAFGFGMRSGVDLQGEAPGNIQNLVKEKDLEYANASFGQGITMTPLQMTAAISAVANKGLLMRPHVVDKKVYRDGTEEMVEIPPVRQVISPETAETLTKMLVSTVERGYDRAKVPGYFVAGKTGTAQISNADKRGYSEETIHSFIGYAPAYRPRFSVFVKIDRPKEARFASESLAPAFSEIMSYLLTYYEIPPDF